MTGGGGAKQDNDSGAMHTYVVPEADEQAGDAEEPEEDAEGPGHGELGGAGLGAEVEGEDDGDGDDGHVDAEAEIGEEGALVGAVIAGVRGLVLKEKGPEEGPCPEGRAARVARAVEGGIVTGGEGEGLGKFYVLFVWWGG